MTARHTLKTCPLCTRAVCVYDARSYGFRFYAHHCKHGLACRPTVGGVPTCIPCQVEGLRTQAGLSRTSDTTGKATR